MLFLQPYHSAHIPADYLLNVLVSGGGTPLNMGDPYSILHMPRRLLVKLVILILIQQLSFLEKRKQEKKQFITKSCNSSLIWWIISSTLTLKDSSSSTLMLRRKWIEAHGRFALFYLSIHFHQEQIYFFPPCKMDRNIPTTVQSLYSPTDRQQK